MQRYQTTCAYTIYPRLLVLLFVFKIVANNIFFVLYIYHCNRFIIDEAFEQVDRCSGYIVDRCSSYIITTFARSRRIKWINRIGLK